MHLRYTILYVKDVEKTLSFYEAAFSLTRGMLHESGDYGELVTGDTKLAFSSIGLMEGLGKKMGEVDPEAPIFEIAFETDNVAQALTNALNAGATLIEDIKDQPWGQQTSYVADLNGFTVEICSPVSPQS